MKGEVIMKRKIIKLTRSGFALFFIICIIYSLSIFSVPSFAADTVFSKGEDLVKDSRGFILKISTPAAVIGLGTGAAFKKFSMGDSQKIKTGSTIQWASIGGWAVVNGAPLIFNTIAQYI